MKKNVQKPLLILALSLIYLLSFSQENNNNADNDSILEPTETEALLDINVKKKSGEVVAGQVIIFQESKTNQNYLCTTNEEGLGQVLVPKGKSYFIKYKNISNEVNYSENVLDIPGGPDLMNFQINLTIEPPRTIELKNVLFETAKATLKPSSFPSPNDLYEVMKVRKGMTIEIAGHTDNVGAADMNMRLSQNRAEAVRTYLINKGIIADRIVAKGYGDTEPVASNSTDEGRQKNRRTEVRIIKEK